MRSAVRSALRSPFTVSVALAAGGVVGTPAAVRAQDTTFARGAIVRVAGRALPLGPREPATVVEQRSDTLVLRAQDGDLLFVPLDRVTRLDVSRGRRSRRDGALRGARAGALVVGGASLVAASVARIQDHGRAPADCDFFCVPNSVLVAAAGALLTGAATLGGAAIGASAPGERWAHVRVPAGVRVGLAPTPRGGSTVALGFRFR